MDGGWGLKEGREGMGWGRIEGEKRKKLFKGSLLPIPQKKKIN